MLSPKPSPTSPTSQTSLSRSAAVAERASRNAYLRAHTGVLLLRISERVQEIWSVPLYDWINVANLICSGCWITTLVLLPHYLETSRGLREVDTIVGRSLLLGISIGLFVYLLASLFSGGKAHNPRDFFSPRLVLRHIGFWAAASLWMLIGCLLWRDGWSPSVGTYLAFGIAQHIAVGQMYQAARGTVMIAEAVDKARGEREDAKDADSASEAARTAIATAIATAPPDSSEGAHNQGEEIR